MLQYRLEGSGLPLLLIHGWGVTYKIWQDLAPLLRPHFQLIMIELPGVGGSPEVDSGQAYYPACAEAIEEIRQSLGIVQCGILGYSTGTRVAEVYVQRYAEHVTHAIFLCPIYLPAWWSLGVHLLDTTHPPQAFKVWIFSNWRIHSLIRALGFNGRRHAYTKLWQSEIEIQPLDTLVRSLCELPGRGRAPFTLPEVPSLFIWGSRDILTVRPRRPSPHDIVIPVNHSAPMLAAASVAEVVIPFLQEGKVVAPYKRGSRWQMRRDKVLPHAQKHVHLPKRMRKASHRGSSLEKRQAVEELERSYHHKN